MERTGELNFEVSQYSECGGEIVGHEGRVPDLVIECLEYLLKKHLEDPEAVKLLKRLSLG